PCCFRSERPLAVQVFERPIYCLCSDGARGPIRNHPARIGLSDRTETDGHPGIAHVFARAIVTLDVHGRDVGQEARIGLEVIDEVEHAIQQMRRVALEEQVRHQAWTSLAFRASRSRAKSSPAW